MSIIDDLANEASTQYARAKATLLGGSGTNNPAPAPQKAAVLGGSDPYAQANKIEQLAQKSGATDAAYAKAQQANAPRYPTGAGAPVNPSYTQGASPEAAAYRAQSGMAGPPSPGTIAGEAVAPRNVPLNATIQKGIDAAKSTFSAQMPSLPAGDGMIARGARYLGNAGMGAIKTIARVAEPVIEGSRVAQVAMDPTMTKADVAQQAVEGGTRWGATAGGASLGAGLGAVAGMGVADPITVPVGAIVGGIAGYAGGDALVNRARAALGLGDKSPAQRSSDRVAAASGKPTTLSDLIVPPASPVAQAAAAATPASATPAKPGQPNVVPGANGSTVQMNADGSSQLASRPTTGNAPAAAATVATATPTIAGEAKAATKTKSAPRASGKAAKASPVAAAANPAADGSDGSEPTGYGVTYADGSTYWHDYNSGIETPAAAQAAGQGQAYRDAVVKGQVQSGNPIDIKQQQELEKQRLINEGRITESQIGAGATVGAAGIQAGAHERASRYSADKAAESVKRNIVLQDETIDDGMGGVKVVKRAYNPDGTPVGVQNQKSKPAPDVATNQANAALKAGASKESVNAILRGYGYPEIK